MVIYSTEIFKDTMEKKPYGIEGRKSFGACNRVRPVFRWFLKEEEAVKFLNKRGIK